MTSNKKITLCWLLIEHEKVVNFLGNIFRYKIYVDISAIIMVYQPKLQFSAICKVTNITCKDNWPKNVELVNLMPPICYLNISNINHNLILTMAADFRSLQSTKSIKTTLSWNMLTSFHDKTKFQSKRKTASIYISIYRYCYYWYIVFKCSSNKRWWLAEKSPG